MSNRFIVQDVHLMCITVVCSLINMIAYVNEALESGHVEAACIMDHNGSVIAQKWKDSSEAFKVSEHSLLEINPGAIHTYSLVSLFLLL